MKTREKARQEEQGTVWLNVMSHLLKGSVLAGIIAVLILLGGAAAISAGLLGQGTMQGIVYAACAIGAFVGALLAIGQSKTNPLVPGLGVSAVLFLLLMTAGLLAYGASGLSVEHAGVPLACGGGGALAALFRRKPKKKRKR